MIEFEMELRDLDDPFFYDTIKSIGYSSWTIGEACKNL